MACETSHAAIGVLVSCHTYRSPDLVADMARTIDHISGGRVVLGYGAGWSQRDYDEYGFDFGTVGSRAAALEPGVMRIKARLAKLNPPPAGALPLMIGGEGERVLLRVAAEHADIWNGFGPATTFARKNRVLDQWCEKVGRDPSTIQRSVLANGPDELDQLDEFITGGAQEIIVPAQAPFDLSALEAVLRAAKRSALHGSGPGGGRSGPDYEPVDLSALCNAGLEVLGDSRRPPIGDQVFHGLPFRIGDPAKPEAQCFVLVEPGETVAVPVGRGAERVVVAHRRLMVRYNDDVRVGQLVAQYMFDTDQTDTTETGLSPRAIPIRERFEIALAPDEGWDSSGPFLAGSNSQFHLPHRYDGRWDEIGLRQGEGAFDWLASYFLWTWENPHPGSVLGKIELAAVAAPVLVAAITVGTLDEHPFTREAARTLRFTARGPHGPLPLREPAVEVDRGVASYAFRLPGEGHIAGEPADPIKGWGELEDPDSAAAYDMTVPAPRSTGTPLTSSPPTSPEPPGRSPAWPPASIWPLSATGSHVTSRPPTR